MPTGMPTHGTGDAAARKPTLKERQRQLREDAILDAAEELLFDKGLGAMTLEELSVHVGISKPTLYQHFRSKDEVISGVMTRGLREATRKVQELAAALPPADAVRALIEWFVERRSENDCGPVTDLCLAVSQIAQGPMRDAEQTFSLEVERLVEAAQKAGTLRPSVPALFISRTLLSISKDRSYRDLLIDGRTDVPTMKRAVVQMLLGD